jgi:hypothetical protein
MNHKREKEMSNIPRKYVMTDIELLSIATNLLAPIQRDMHYFGSRGVSEGDIDSFMELLSECKVLLPDQAYVDAVMLVSKKKKERTKEIYAQARKIANYFIQKFGQGSFEQGQLQMSKMYQLKAFDLINLAYNISLTAEESFSELSKVGLTENDLKDLEMKADLLSVAVEELESAKTDRKNATKERTLKFNELFVTMKMLCKIGKLIWEDDNSSKYKQYLVYRGKNKPKNN